MQFAYTRSSTSTECPARRATVGAGTPLARLTPEVRATLSACELFVREYVASGPMYWYDPTYDCSWLWEGVAPDWPIVERLFELFETYDLAPHHVPSVLARVDRLARGRAQPRVVRGSP